MNNDQFRKLVQNTPRATASTSQTPRNNGATPSAALGSRMRSSIPMTPRSIAGAYNPSNDFARQLAERNASLLPQTTKKFRQTATPKGAKLPEGYVDRAKARVGDAEEEGGGESDKVQRVKALEEMMKLSQIDEETFVKLREDILGSEVAERAALVKGLDWRLLERVRRGEVGVQDVLGGEKEGDGDNDDGEDVDDEFEELDAVVGTVEGVTKEKIKKKGEMAPPSLTGKKRNRDQILQEMKAARLAAKEAAQPSLGSKFKKFGEKRTESRIERDGKGREVLITVDEHGNEKRKVRRVQAEEVVVEKDLGLLMPDKDLKPLGMEVPDIPKVEEEEEDIDIFDDVGDDYDPLAGLIDSDSASEAEGETEEGEVSEDTPKPTPKVTTEKTTSIMPPPPRPAQKPRNYFSTPTTSTSESTPLERPKALTDPTLLAAIKKASTLNNPIPKAADEAAKDAKHKKMLQQDDRDAQDMDMGFGSSRFEDEADADESASKIKLSEWGAGGDEDEEGGKKGGDKGKRKRGPKKRKGDANSAADVLAVMERRKGEKK